MMANHVCLSHEKVIARSIQFIIEEIRRPIEESKGNHTEIHRFLRKCLNNVISLFCS